MRLSLSTSSSPLGVLNMAIVPLVVRHAAAQGNNPTEEEEEEPDDREDQPQNVAPTPADEEEDNAAENTAAEEGDEPTPTPEESPADDEAEETPTSDDEPAPVTPTPTSATEDEDEDEPTTTPETTPERTATPVSLTSITDAPSLTTSNSVFRLTDLPTIAGVGIPTQVVPFTGNAPFMQKSNLPEGTVFIGVGAFLAFCVFGIFVWRGIVALTLHRAVKRAAMQHSMPESKSMLRTPGSAFYSAGPGSSLSLDRLTATTGRPLSKPERSSVAPSAAARSSLFFSPTAAAGAGNVHAHNNRSSSYLPAGYYTAGSSAPAGGAPMTHVGGAGLTNPISTLTAQAAGYQRARSMGITPPASPGLPPSRGTDAVSSNQRMPSRGVDHGGHGRMGSFPNGLASGSTSSVNLAAPPQGRAPSAYLEDLFANHGNGPR